MPFPNKDSQFRPGQSGNPGGRPKGPSITARVRKLLEERKTGDGRKLPGRKQFADLVAEAILKEALKGNSKILWPLLERLEGKVPEELRGQVELKLYATENTPDDL